MNFEWNQQNNTNWSKLIKKYISYKQKITIMEFQYFLLVVFIVISNHFIIVVCSINDPICAINKETVRECLFLKTDFNQDQQITKDEINKGISKYLSYIAQFTFNQVGGVDYIFNLCDTNGDNVLTKDEKMTTACLNSCNIRETIISQLKCNNINNNVNDKKIKKQEATNTKKTTTRKETMKKVGNSPLLIEDGLYCGRKTLNMWLVSYTVIATARIKQKALFNFRLNGDVHLSWCKENVIDYVDRVLLGSKDVKIRPAKCMEDVLKKYGLKVPVAHYVNKHEFDLNVNALAGLTSVSVKFTPCSTEEASYYIQNWKKLGDKKYISSTASPTPSSSRSDL